MVTRLGDLLRAILHDAEVQEVPLETKLECLKLISASRKYALAIGSRPCFKVEAETLDAAGPHMSMQPLVENAVHHGVSRRAAVGCITVTARRSDKHLEIRIVDNGPGLAVDSIPNQVGVELKNSPRIPNTPAFSRQQRHSSMFRCGKASWGRVWRSGLLSPRARWARLVRNSVSWLPGGD
jgi:LytS/YehU family sensor histidine kinase